jgi:hypothetical protein
MWRSARSFFLLSAATEQEISQADHQLLNLFIPRLLSRFLWMAHPDWTPTREQAPSL